MSSSSMVYSVIHRIFVKHLYGPNSKWVFVKSNIWRNGLGSRSLSFTCFRFWTNKLRHSIKPINYFSTYPKPRDVIGGASLGAMFGLFDDREDDEVLKERVVMHIKKGILYSEREDYAAAHLELMEAFHLCKKYGFEDALTQVVSYQANTYYKTGQLKRAEELFKFLSQRLVALGKVSPTDNSFVEMSLKLAEIYDKTGRLDDAMTGYQYCVIAQKDKIDAGADDVDTLLLGAWSLHNLSQIYIRIASPSEKNDIHLAKAVFCLRKADAYATKALGPEAQQSIAIKSDLATALALKGDQVNALKIFDTIGEVARVNHEAMYPGLRVNIGNIYLQKSEFEQAHHICSEAKDLALKFKDMDTFRRAENCVSQSESGRKNMESSTVTDQESAT